MKNPLAFPKQVTIDLERFHRAGLEQLANMIPHESDELLLKLVISRGLLAMLDEQLERAPVSPEKVSLNAKARLHELRSHGVRPFPKPGVLFRRRQKAHQDAVREIENQHEPDPAEVFNDLGQAEDGDVHAMPHRHVEQYLWVLMPEKMRQSFEDFLDAHPDLDENDALRLLLGRALHQEGFADAPESEDDKKFGEPLGVKEAARREHRAAWRELCRNVARGWR